MIYIVINRWLEKREDIKDIYEAFFLTFINNYLKFPSKNQKTDNTKSIFEETSFKNLPKNYLEFFDLSSIRKKRWFSLKKQLSSCNIIQISSLDEIEKIDNNRVIGGKIGSINIHDKLGSNELETKSPVDIKKQNSPVQYHMLETKSPVTRGQEKFINTFKFITTTESQLKLLKSKGNEFIDVLNMMINNYSPENPDKNTIHLSLFDNSILSIIETPKDKNIATRLIMRNLSGRFAWEFNHIRAFNDNVFIDTQQCNLNNIALEKFRASSSNDISATQVSGLSNANPDTQNIVRDTLRSKTISSFSDVLSNVTMTDSLRDFEEIRELHEDQ